MAHEHSRASIANGRSNTSHYARLISMVVLSFIAMYILMYSMVNTYDAVYHNVNQFYMAGLMAAPMMTIELLVMRTMYANRRLNAALVAVSLVAAGAFFVGIRRQAAVSEEQFLRSMIPHHSGAILMCREARIETREVKQLCAGIVSSQQAEIDQMKALLRR